MRSFMKLLSQCFFIVVVLFCYVGCHQAPPTALRIGTNVWPGYEPFYLAQAQGYYKDLNVRLVEYPSASEVLRAFKNGNLEAAALTLDEVVYLRRSSPDVKIALVMDVSHGGDVIIAKEGIENVEDDLRGKRVAVESNALGAYFISRALEMHGMRPEDISVVHIEVSGHEEAFLQDRVDAAVTFEPVRTKLLAAGGKEIFSSREIPGEIVDVLVVHVPVERSVAAFQMDDAWYAVGSVRDITDRKNAEKALLELATIDFLTSLNNRRNFLELSAGEIERAQRYVLPPCCFYV